jgi:hypothetical protein
MKPQYLMMLPMAMCFAYTPAPGQVLNRIKQKVEQKLENKVENEIDEVLDENDNNQENPGTPTSTESSARNRGGAGLVTTPPDIDQNLIDAETSFSASKYNETRYALQQAMLGVEMEIGQEILKSLPEEIINLQKDKSADQVTSTGWGWVGLTIMCRYAGGDEQEFKVTVANNSMWLAAANMYLANGGYAQTTEGEQQWKQTKIQNYRAVIEYDDYSGYKLSVPVGQASIVVFEGINFETEQQMMDAANTIQLDDIKSKLGEQ